MLNMRLLVKTCGFPLALTGSSVQAVHKKSDSSLRGADGVWSVVRTRNDAGKSFQQREREFHQHYIFAVSLLSLRDLPPRPAIKQPSISALWLWRSAAAWRLQLQRIVPIRLLMIVVNLDGEGMKVGPMAVQTSIIVEKPHRLGEQFSEGLKAKGGG